MASKDSKKIDELLTRGIEAIYPSRPELKKALMSGKRLRFYLGIDPSGSKLHIGHSVPLLLLKRLHALGHEVILLVGSFTAQLGDPTGKTEARVPKTLKEVLANAASYEAQASLILNFRDKKNPVRMLYNHAWLAPLTLADTVNLASHFTVQQMIQRDMFQERIKNSAPIGLHEFLYPLLQGYDSVAMDVDGEIGATEQTFNMLAGRTLMKKMKNKEKFVLVTKLLIDATGRKLGKSEGNAINVTDKPREQFGKIMALADDVIIPAFEMCTEAPLVDVRALERALAGGKNPRDAKLMLAQEIVRMYHGADAAADAAAYFVQTIQRHEMPESVPEFSVIGKNQWNLIDVLKDAGLVASKAEARRVVRQGGVKVGGAVITDEAYVLDVDGTGTIIQKGKHQFIRVRLGI